MMRIAEEVMPVLPVFSELMPFGIGSFAELMPIDMDSFLVPMRMDMGSG